MSNRPNLESGSPVFFAALLCVLAIFIQPQFIGALDTSDIFGDTFEETEGNGLLIRTKPAGVRVFIDGIERGQTPFTGAILRPGDYNIRLFKEGYAERRFKLTLSAKSRMTVSIEMEELKGRVTVNVYRAEGSPPELPLVPLINGGWGESTETILELPVGIRTIRVRAFGWEEASETVSISEQMPLTVNVSLMPVPFSISSGSVSRRSFNPNNSGGLGETDFYFSVSAPGSGALLIQDQSGAIVYAVSLGAFETPAQKVSWNGRDYSGAVLPEGPYTAIIIAESLFDFDDTEDANREINQQIQIDYALKIYPLNFAGGIPGLLFAPAPDALPVGSLQLNALFMFGNFSVPEKHAANQEENKFLLYPVSFGARFSVLERLDLGGMFNVNAANRENSGFGFSIFAKYNFLKGAGTYPMGLALGLSYTFANLNGEFPPGTGRGIDLYIPVSLKTGPVKTLFSPGMRWPGMEDPIPRLMLSAGLMYQGAWNTIGLSVREEFDFTNSGIRFGIPFSQRLRFHGGLEINLYPRPSYVVYTASCGMWIHGDRMGGFGGLGLGFVY